MQKNYTVLKGHAKLLESKKKELEVPHFANFAEALRRINVFSSGCQQAIQDQALRDQVK